MRILLALLLLAGVALGDGPMSGFNTDTATMYDEEVVVSNLVYAINERCRALYRGFTTVSNCMDSEAIVHQYWVDPIATESWTFAWGTNYGERVMTGTNVEANAQGVLVTNLYFYTNLYVSFEYDDDEALPTGYVRIARSRVLFDSVHMQSYRPFSYYHWYRDATGEIVSNVLLKVIYDDYTDPDGLRIIGYIPRYLSTVQPYLPCETNYYFNVSTLTREIFTKTIQLTGYYLDHGLEEEGRHLKNYSKPKWEWFETSPRGPVTEERDALGNLVETPGIKLFDNGRGELVEPPICGDSSGYPCWTYQWNYQWRNLSDFTVRDQYPIRSVESYIAPVGRSVIASNDFSVDDINVGGVDGWHEGQIDTRTVDVLASPDAVFSPVLQEAHYSVTSFQASAAVELRPLGTNNVREYAALTNLVPIAQVGYQITDSMERGDLIYTYIWSEAENWWEEELIDTKITTNELGYRVYEPLLTIYDEAWRKPNANLYTDEELKSPLYYLTTRSVSTNAHDPYPDYSLPVQFNSLVFTQRIDDTYFYYGDYPDGWYWWGNAGYSDPSWEPAAASNELLLSSDVEELQQLDWHGYEITSLSFTNSPKFTSLYEVVSVDNGVTNWGWVPDFNITLQHNIYRENSLPVLTEIPTSSDPTYSAGGFTYSPDLAAVLWKMLIRMKTTYVTAWALSPNHYTIEPQDDGTVFRRYALWFKHEQLTTIQRTVIPTETNRTWVVLDDYYSWSRAFGPAAPGNIDTIMSMVSNRWIDATGGQYQSPHFEISQRRMDEEQRWGANWAWGFFDADWPDWPADRDRHAINYTRNLIESTGTIGGQAFKHPDATGTLRGFELVEYGNPDPPFDHRTLAPKNWYPYDPDEPWWNQCGSTHEYTGHTHHQYELPEDQIVDEGVIFDEVVSAGSSYVDVSLSYETLPFLPPAIGYDDVGILDDHWEDGRVICPAIAYGSARSSRRSSGTRIYDFFWEWNFIYATE